MGLCQGAPIDTVPMLVPSAAVELSAGLLDSRRDAPAPHCSASLRPVDEDDLETLLAIRNAPAVVATTSTGEPLPRERMSEQLSRRLASWRERGLGSWLVLLDREPVAFVEVAPIGEGSGVDPDAIEIGVVVHPDQWGKGIALEAGLAARDLLRPYRASTGSTLESTPTTTSPCGRSRRRPGARIDDELYELTADALLD